MVPTLQIKTWEHNPYLAFCQGLAPSWECCKHAARARHINASLGVGWGNAQISTSSMRPGSMSHRPGKIVQDKGSQCRRLKSVREAEWGSIRAGARPGWLRQDPNPGPWHGWPYLGCSDFPSDFTGKDPSSPLGMAATQHGYGEITPFIPSCVATTFYSIPDAVQANWPACSSTW